VDCCCCFSRTTCLPVDCCCCFSRTTCLPADSCCFSGTTCLPEDCSCCFSGTTCLPLDCCYCFSVTCLPVDCCYCFSGTTCLPVDCCYCFSGTSCLPVDCCCCFSRTTCLPADCCCFSELALYNLSKRVGLVQRGHHHVFVVLFHIQNLLCRCVFWSFQWQHPYFWTVPTLCQSIEYIKPNFYKVSPWSVFHFYLRGSGYDHDNHDTDFCLPL
jgi:hypothetical protein